MVVILPVTLLAACSGGSGRTPTATETLPELPDPLITNTEQARRLVEGDIPNPTSHRGIRDIPIRIATQSDTILFSEINNVPRMPETARIIDCTQYRTYAGMVGDGTNTHRTEYSVGNRFFRTSQD